MAWIPAAAALASTVMGQEQARQAQTQAENAQKNALAQWTNIKTPSIEDQTLALENYQNAGTLSPEMLQALGLGDTALSDVTTDPRLKSEQMAALAQISGFASGNPQAGDMAGFQLARQNAAGEAQAKNGQILQEMQQRGQAGSGAELLAKLKNSQNSAQMLATQDMEQAQAMQQARMQALQAQGNMASNIRSQDYSQDANLASARDNIAKYNAQNSQNVAATNVAAKNNAQAANLQNSQNIGNMNTGVANQQQMANKGLLQQQFNNQTTLAAGATGQYNKNSDSAYKQAANEAKSAGQMGQGIGTLLQSFQSK